MTASLAVREQGLLTLGWLVQLIERGLDFATPGCKRRNTLTNRIMVNPCDGRTEKLPIENRMRPVIALASIAEVQTFCEEYLLIPGRADGPSHTRGDFGALARSY